mmetsp:Transcript_72901/g.169003  ORF Transcript_72901/g.169003 Transcript_72901/m.169003 type:complete len:210 (-) Transcript_72901:24-653(-)
MGQPREEERPASSVLLPGSRTCFPRDDPPPACRSWRRVCSLHQEPSRGKKMGVEAVVCKRIKDRADAERDKQSFKLLHVHGTQRPIRVGVTQTVEDLLGCLGRQLRLHELCPQVLKKPREDVYGRTTFRDPGQVQQQDKRRGKPRRQHHSCIPSSRKRHFRRRWLSFCPRKRHCPYKGCNRSGHHACNAPTTAHVKCPEATQDRQHHPS